MPTFVVAKSCYPHKQIYKYYKPLYFFSMYFLLSLPSVSIFLLLTIPIVPVSNKTTVVVAM